MSEEHEIERWSGFFSAFYSLIWGNPLSNQRLVEVAAVGPGDKILDIGSGPGAALEHARKAGADVVGVDPSPAMVRRASRRVPEATVVEGHAESLPFPNDEFTHVWAISTFHHWASPEAGLNEVRRVLAPGGRFLVVERKLKAGKSGHGFDTDRAQQLSAEIKARGFRDCLVDTMAAKRAEYLVISGRL